MDETDNFDEEMTIRFTAAVESIADSFRRYVDCIEQNAAQTMEMVRAQTAASEALRKEIESGL